MENQDQNNNSLKESIKEIIKKIREEIKKELLQEIYDDLKREEDDLSEEVASSLLIKQKHTKKIETLPPIIEKIQKKKSDVEITIKAILKIASHALKYANEKIATKKWVEVIGLLAGKLNGGILIIEDAYPMGHGTAFYAEIKDYKNYVRAYNDIKEKKLFICGWYHSHPSYGCFMSNEDLVTQERYQKLWDSAVALVIDPYQIDGTSAGFEIFRANLNSKKWFPVSYKIKGDLNVKMIPEVINFINPIIYGKAIYLEYDEDD